ncbi:hypothetical protein E0J09_03530 [Rhizobium leguminosarum bv. viciae]|uniref:hypothetical protein n=1 Tax=Rhizobium leguminosarum TaxID=384 RepID=UPI001040800A|nr:hypothetical protein [Rhizobium leguminosarum]TCB30459.1 hypothetical protein E0J09_03530 [Rhizobium leguminosarum bv. viciae]
MNDPEWREWSDREIARRCRVGHPLVAKMRTELEPREDTGTNSSMDRTFIHPKTGEPALMDTGGINAGRDRRLGHVEWLDAGKHGFSEWP